MKKPFSGFKSTFQELAQWLKTLWYADDFLRTLIKTKERVTRKRSETKIRKEAAEFFLSPGQPV